jgi:hypothetical protein
MDGCVRDNRECSFWYWVSLNPDDGFMILYLWQMMSTATVASESGKMPQPYRPAIRPGDLLQGIEQRQAGD